MNDDKQFSLAGDVLKTLFDRLLPDEAAGYTKFFSGWDKIAGPETAMHVFPRDIVNNVLILETDHPGWSQQIRMRQEWLLKTIQKNYPDLEIKKIRIVIGDGKKKSISPVPDHDRKPVETDVQNKPVSEAIGEEKESFFGLLETMRRRGDS